MAVLLGSDRNSPDAIHSLIAETLPGSVFVCSILALVHVLDKLYALAAADGGAALPWPDGGAALPWPAFPQGLSADPVATNINAVLQSHNGHSDWRLQPRSAAAISEDRDVGRRLK